MTSLIPLLIGSQDGRDRVEVFLYNNLSTIISPHPEVLLTPSVRASLIDMINGLPGGYGFPPDLQEVLNVFVLENINQVSVSARLLEMTAIRYNKFRKLN